MNTLHAYPVELSPLILLAIVAATSLLVQIIRYRKEQSMKPELKKLIEETKGKFFSLEFKTKEGHSRKVNGKDFYHRLLAGGKNKVEGAGYTALVNRNTESWVCAKDENVVVFQCGKIRKTLNV
jgi:hypothetical protein